MNTFLKSSLLLIVGCIMQLLSAPIATAGTTCFPDSCQNPFGITRTTTIRIDSCYVTVWYRSRTSCNGFYDMTIDSLRPLSDSCRRFSLFTLVDRASTELIKANPRNFPLPGLDSCSMKYRITKRACWGWQRFYWADSLGAHVDSTAKGCDTVACCVAEYRICRDSTGKLTYHRMNQRQIGACDTNAVHCENVCISGDPQWTPDSDLKLTLRDRTVGSPLHSTISLYPNPAKSSVVFEVNAATEGVLGIGIFDATGTEVAHLHGEQISPGRYSVLVNTGDLPNGSYQYRVTIGSVEHTGKLLIQR